MINNSILIKIISFQVYAGVEGGIFWQMVGDLKEVKEPSTGISGGRDCQTEGLACAKALRSDPAWHVRC